MKLKIKRLSDKAVIPSYAKPGDAGLDLTAISRGYEESEDGSKIIVYGTGLAFEIPDGYVGLIFPRSSISKTSLSLSNAVPVIDSSFRGEVKLKFRVDANAKLNLKNVYKVGDRIGQLMIIPYPTIEFEEVYSLSETERGSGGFGSTGA